jgi:V/A-type H+-transporting ATPase subunit K
MTRHQRRFQKKLILFGAVLVIILMGIVSLSSVKLLAQMQETQLVSDNSTNESSETTEDKIRNPDAVKFAFLSAAIAVGVGSIGAGAAVGYVGAAAMGAIGEKPELSGRALIFVGLAEGIAIYGLIIAIMILGKV